MNVVSVCEHKARILLRLEGPKMKWQGRAVLSHLSIKGLAIVDQLALDLESGFNVITGETGAGKSIWIKGLSLVLGGKIQADSVRAGVDTASLVARFQIPKKHPARKVLGEHGLDVDPESEIIVRRIIQAKGKSAFWVNDIPVTGTVVRELGQTLVDVFAQHENQRLLVSDEHIHYVDDFLPDKNISSAVKSAYSTCLETVGELRSLNEKTATLAKQREFLSFRATELRELSPSQDDFSQLKEFCSQAEQNVKLRDQYGGWLACLEAAEGESSVLDRLSELAKQLTRAKGIPIADKMTERVRGVLSEISEIHYELSSFNQGAELDEGELEKAQSRLFRYQELCRKMGVRGVDELILEMERIFSELNLLETASQEISHLLKKLQKQISECATFSASLTKARGKAAKNLVLAVEKELKELAMPGVRFGVDFENISKTPEKLDLSAFGETAQEKWESLAEELSHLSLRGAEKCQFLLSANPGEPLLPLARIASGGELSRLMLALKKALSVDGDTCVLVFDEIDTGISGKVADTVGKKLRELSETFQIVCVSHLPQVAVYADTHFLVRKMKKGGRTESEIVKLGRDESAHEIARLLSGEEVSKPSLQNAMALIQKAKSKTKRSQASAH